LSGISGGGEDGELSAVAESVKPAPALICAALTVALNRIPYGGFFFMIPLGTAVLVWGGKTGWAAAAAALAGNAALTLVLALSGGVPWDWTKVLYFSLLSVLLAWIMAPPVPGPVEAGGGGTQKAPLFRFGSAAGKLFGGAAPTPLRLVAASFFWAAAMGFLLAREGKGGAFYSLLQAQGEFISSLYRAAQGVNVVEQAMLEQYLSPQAAADLILGITLRGGALASCALLFMVSMQGAALVKFFLRRVRPATRLAEYHAGPALIWLLSLSLAAIVLGRKTGFVPVEIFAWNVLASSVILYLAQGIGIVSFFLSHRALPFWVRIGINILIVCMVFSPVFNLILLSAVVVLGIAENWAPFRASGKLDGDHSGPSSTPGEKNDPPD
jgi:hypothetical protein